MIKRICTLMVCMTMCGAALFAQAPATDFDTKAAGKGVVITKYKGKSKDVAIPAILGGKVVVGIGERAFAWNRSLVSVTIPAGVTTIGKAAFSECKSLTAISVAAANRRYQAIDGVLFTKDGKTLHTYPAGGETAYRIPDSVTAIGEWAFTDCSSLTSVTIPNSVTTIGESAFSNSGLTSVTIPNSVTTIGEYAFYGCSSLTSVTIPDGITAIGSKAFSGSGLTSVTIPAGVTTIGAEAFSHCKSLTAISVAAANRRYTGIYGVVFTKDGKTLVAYPAGGQTDYTVPMGVTDIGNGAFFYCISLTSVTIPAGVTSIGAGAFSFCSRLTSVTIPAGVTTIGANAFYECSNLTSVTIPTSVTSVGDGAFSHCNKLKPEVRADIEKRFGKKAF